MQRKQRGGARALLAMLHTLRRQLHHRDVGTGLCKRRCCGAYPAPDFEHLFALPLVEFRKGRDMVLNMVLSARYLFPVPLAAVLYTVKLPARIARPAIPVASNLVGCTCRSQP